VQANRRSFSSDDVPRKSARIAKPTSNHPAGHAPLQAARPHFRAICVKETVKSPEVARQLDPRFAVAFAAVHNAQSPRVVKKKILRICVVVF
jgi:hypothetical protein